jgi:hypothetical protein
MGYWLYQIVLERVAGSVTDAIAGFLVGFWFGHLLADWILDLPVRAMWLLMLAFAISGVYLAGWQARKAWLG